MNSDARVEFLFGWLKVIGCLFLSSQLKGLSFFVIGKCNSNLIIRVGYVWHLCSNLRSEIECFFLLPLPTTTYANPCLLGIITIYNTTLSCLAITQALHRHCLFQFIESPFLCGFTPPLAFLCSFASISYAKTYPTTSYLKDFTV